MAGASAVRMGKAEVVITANMQNFLQGMQRVNNRITQLGTDTLNLSKQLIKWGSLLAAPFALMTKESAEYEKSLGMIIGLVGVSQEEVIQFDKAIQDMAVAVGQTPTALADAMFFITSAGLRGRQALEALEVSAQASAAGLGEVKVIADLVTSAMNAYGAENLNARAATDVLVAAVREGKAEAPALAASLGQVLPIASAMGVSFDQVGAAVAAMTRTGTDAATATTQLRQILATILNPTSEAKEVLEQFGFSSAQVRREVREKGLLSVLMRLKDTMQVNEEAMGSVFGNIRALSGVLDLLGSNSEATEAVFRSMANYTGALDKAFKQSSNGIMFQLNQVWSAIKLGMLKVGRAVAPIFRGILDLVLPFIQGLSDWIEKNQWVARSIVALALGLIGLGVALIFDGVRLVIIGKLLSYITATAQIFLLGVQGLITGIKSLVYAKYLWIAVTKIIQALMITSHAVTAGFMLVVRGLAASWIFLRSTLALANISMVASFAMMQGMVIAIRLVEVTTKAFAGSLFFLRSVLTVVRTSMMALRLSWVLTAAAIVAGAFVIKALGVIAMAVSILVGLFTGVVYLASTAFNVFAASSALATIATTIWSGILAVATGATAIYKIGAAALTAIMTALGGATNFASLAFAALTAVIIAAPIAILAYALYQVVQSTNAISDAWTELKDSMTSGFTNIAAGASNLWSGISGNALAAFRGIKAAIQNQDWGAAWEILKVSFELLWFDLKAFFKDTFIELKYIALGIFSTLGDALKRLFVETWAEAKVTIGLISREEANREREVMEGNINAARLDRAIRNELSRRLELQAAQANETDAERLRGIVAQLGDANIAGSIGRAAEELGINVDEFYRRMQAEVSPVTPQGRQGIIPERPPARPDQRIGLEPLPVLPDRAGARAEILRRQQALVDRATGDYKAYANAFLGAKEKTGLGLFGLLPSASKAAGALAAAPSPPQIALGGAFGSFSAAALAFGGARSPEERTAAATEENNRRLEDIQRELQRIREAGGVIVG